MENDIRDAVKEAALNVNNLQYAEAMDEPGGISLFPRGSQLVLLIDVSYDWQSFESGFEENDLKQKLLYGPKSRSILPKLSKNGRIIDPGGRWNIVPFDGGERFRTVSTPRFDGYGRLKGSDPTSWVIPAKPVRRIMDNVLAELEPQFQATIDSL